MTIEMPAAEVHALAATLGHQAATAEEAGTRLIPRSGFHGPLAGPVVEFLDAHRAGCRALSGELDRLASVVHAVADSWLGLDEVLLAARGRAPRA